MEKMVTFKEIMDICESKNNDSTIEYGTEKGEPYIKIYDPPSDVFIFSIDEGDSTFVVEEDSITILNPPPLKDSGSITEGKIYMTIKQKKLKKSIERQIEDINERQKLSLKNRRRKESRIYRELIKVGNFIKEKNLDEGTTDAFLSLSDLIIKHIKAEDLDLAENVLKLLSVYKVEIQQQEDDDYPQIRITFSKLEEFKKQLTIFLERVKETGKTIKETFIEIFQYKGHFYFGMYGNEGGAE